MAVQKYGVTPWGKWFIDIIESYDIGSRLDRGRSCANTGKVASFEFEKQTNIIKAKVEGRYWNLYKVKIIFPQLLDDEKNKILELLKKDPSLLAGLSAGTLPEEFITKLKKESIYLIPKKLDDIKMSCSCPDSVHICKHIAALYYVLTKQIDADPHTLFKIRGLDLSSIAAEHGLALEIDDNIAPPFEILSERGEPDKMLTKELANFELDEIPHCTSLITSLLVPNPSFVTERDFSVILTEFYHQAARTYNVDLMNDDEDADEHRASRSVWHIECANAKPGAKVYFIQKTIQGQEIKYNAYDAFTMFRSFSLDTGTYSYVYLFKLFKFINLIISAGAYIPYPIVNDMALSVLYVIYDKMPQIQDALKKLYAQKTYMLCINRGRNTFADGKTIVNLVSSSVISGFVKHCTFIYQGGSARLHKFISLFFMGRFFDVTGPASRTIPIAIQRWLSVLYTDFNAYHYIIYLKEKISKRKTDSDIQFSMSLDVMINGEIVALKNAVKVSGNINVLKAPTALSNYLPEINSLFTKGDITLKEERLVDFLDYAADLLSKLGLEVILPKKLHRELKPRLILSADAPDRKRKSESLVKYLELGSLLDFEWKVAIGDAYVSKAEFESIVQQKTSIVKFKNQFIRINPDELSDLFKRTERENKSAVPPNEFLKAHFSGNTTLSHSADEVIKKLFKTHIYPPPTALNASLREYQMNGYNWVLSLLMSGFGCILADDMGLGKTIQSIAVLLRLKEEAMLRTASLVIAPAALLENWEKEFSRFAENLTVLRYHGKGRTIDLTKDIILTTYQTAVRDFEKLKEITFSLLIVDEAHLMKNEDTRISQTVKVLKSDYRLALSGTPVENRLEDMRSLFDYIIPGYLGTKEVFKKEYRIPIEVERQKEKAEKLRKITSPFLLRRLKTDKKIISDLPDKVTINEYSVLEKEQAALYQSIVRENLQKIEHTDNPIARSALVLSLLTALKQVCDHPRVFDKQSPAISKLSGKAMLLLTLLREILDNNEKVIVFSQYVSTLECLQTIITNELDEDSIIYHGSMTQSKRNEAVEFFMNDPSQKIMLISIRAGGLGLNLTEASRIIHYDLWYNPAVEAQATDRAFRIGQKRNVFVHRLIVKNTFEEKIDAMITAKKELAEMTVSTGESWLAKMSASELKELFL